MPPFIRPLFLLALLVTSLLTACSDRNEEPAPAPDPTPTYETSHYFYYPATNGGAAVNHPNQDVTGSAVPDMPHFAVGPAPA